MRIEEGFWDWVAAWLRYWWGRLFRWPPQTQTEPTAFAAVVGERLPISFEQTEKFLAHLAALQEQVDRLTAVAGIPIAAMPPHENLEVVAAATQPVQKVDAVPATVQVIEQKPPAEAVPMPPPAQSVRSDGGELADPDRYSGDVYARIDLFFEACMVRKKGAQTDVREIRDRYKAYCRKRKLSIAYSEAFLDALEVCVGRGNIVVDGGSVYALGVTPR